MKKHILQYGQIFLCCFFLAGLTTCANKLLEDATGKPLASTTSGSGSGGGDLPGDLYRDANFYIITNNNGGLKEIENIYKTKTTEEHKDLIFALGENITYSGSTLALRAEGDPTTEQPFCSKFYGNGKIITLSGGKGLFKKAATGAMFKVVVIKVPSGKSITSLSTDDAVGVLIGESTDTVEFTDVTVFGDIGLTSGVTAMPSGHLYAGGIVGKIIVDPTSPPAPAKKITRCAYLGNININSGGSFTYEIYTGGITGQFATSTRAASPTAAAEIKISFAAAQFNVRGGSGAVLVGGICAKSDNGNISSCYVNGTSIEAQSDGTAKAASIAATSNADISNSAALVKRLIVSTSGVVNRIATVVGSVTNSNYAYASMYSEIASTPTSTWTENNMNGKNATPNGSAYGSVPEIYFGLDPSTYSRNKGFYHTAEARSTMGSDIILSPLDWDFTTSTDSTGTVTVTGDWRWLSGWPLPLPAKWLTPPARSYYTSLQ